MKKVYVLMIALLMTSVTFAQVAVTFQVDMSKQTVGSNGVHVAGSFQKAAGFAGDWDPATSELTDPDKDGVYTLTVTLPKDSTYAYKYVNGNAWGSDESVPSACNVNGNRELKVPATGPYSIPKVCFKLCEACPTAVDTVMLTLKVDMSKQTVSSNGVHVAGGFAAGGYAEWSPNGIGLTDANADNVYEVTLKLPEGEYPFKFINGDAWGSDEGVPGNCSSGGNRTVKLVGNGDAVSEGGFTKTYIAPFTLCPPADSVDMTFMVDMNNQTVNANGVHLAGSFGQAGLANWDPSAIALTDANKDGIYEVTLRLSEGNYAYKFVNGNAWGGDEAIPPACNVGGNRSYDAMGDGDAWSNNISKSLKVCFSKCVESCPPLLPPVNVTFRVDMSNEIVSANGIYVAGAFPGAGWVKDSFEMTDANSDEIFEYTFTKLPVADYLFKFYNGDCGDVGCNETFDFKKAGCGVDNGVGGWNRYIDLQNATKDTVLNVFVYNSCETSKLSIANHLPNTFKVYPNPTSGFVNVSFKQDANNYKVHMLDLNGRVVLNTTATNNDVRLNIQDLTPGMYLMIITDNNGASAFEKLIVQ